VKLWQNQLYVIVNETQGCASLMGGIHACSSLKQAYLEKVTDISK